MDLNTDLNFCILKKVSVSVFRQRSLQTETLTVKDESAPFQERVPLLACGGAVQLKEKPDKPSMQLLAGIRGERRPVCFRRCL